MFGTFGQSSELDEALANVEKAMNENNHWDASVYASQALKLIEEGKVNPDLDKKLLGDVVLVLGSVRDTAERIIAALKEQEKQQQEAKDKLIDEIVNFKG